MPQTSTKTATKQLAVTGRAAGLLCVAAGLACGLAATESGAAPADAPAEKISIEALLKDGWEIAGFTGAVDNWSTFILLRKPGEPSLVQCRAGYDVTREPRVQTNCYRLR